MAQPQHYFCFSHLSILLMDRKAKPPPHISLFAFSFSWRPLQRCADGSPDASGPNSNLASWVRCRFLPTLACHVVFQPGAYLYIFREYQGRWARAFIYKYSYITFGLLWSGHKVGVNMYQPLDQSVSSLISTCSEEWEGWHWTQLNQRSRPH
jgi:hypothetical protein